MRVTPPGAVARCTVTNSRKVFPVADFEVGRLARVLQILRALAKAREGVKLVVRADDRRPRQHDVAVQPAARPQRHAGPTTQYGPISTPSPSCAEASIDGGGMDGAPS